MRDFACTTCGQRLAFENTECLHCHSRLGYSLPERQLRVLDENQTVSVDGVVHERCACARTARCNWLAPTTASEGMCASCALTRTRPAASSDAMGAFGDAEAAKRRLVVELTELGLPITGRSVDPDGGLCFDLLDSSSTNVITGHASGVITLDLAEGDDVHREQLRVSMEEPYRTLLGHFRHETGHYYFTVLVGAGPELPRFTELFGDPASDYQAALDRHYSQGAPDGWEQDHVSSYATMHPAEDWAETFAHYLHIRDTLDTAAAFGFAPAGMTLEGPVPGRVGFDRIIELWLPLAWSLNMINRSMGHADLYPFVLRGRVLEKMAFVHELVTGASS
ncbi:putative zinc-binding metallopeptidase [Rhodococcus aerolatus]